MNLRFLFVGMGFDFLHFSLFSKMLEAIKSPLLYWLSFHSFYIRRSCSLSVSWRQWPDIETLRFCCLIAYKEALFQQSDAPLQSLIFVSFSRSSLSLSWLFPWKSAVIYFPHHPTHCWQYLPAANSSHCEALPGQFIRSALKYGFPTKVNRLIDLHVRTTGKNLPVLLACFSSLIYKLICLSWRAPIFWPGGLK